MKDWQASSSFPARDHDHGACVAGALGRAKARCLEKGIKWTPLREQIFRHVSTSHKPVSAYDLIESVAKEGKRLAPVSIYRILDVLQEAGIVHRLESRNAFFACMSGHDSAMHTVTFICDLCERVTEIEAPGAYRAIDEVSQANRFLPRSTIVEVCGTCAECHGSAGAQC
jgi:Fur family transcriptional regulator, zinc uptake regulator